MADKVTRASDRGYISRLMGSLQGILICLMIFISSIGVLFWNEGRVNVTNIAERAGEIISTESSNPAQGTLVSTTGTVSTGGKTGDGTYLVEGNYLAVKRDVEIYAWKEEPETGEEETWREKEKTTTNVLYKNDWVKTPEDSSKFEEPTGHYNPDKQIADGEYTARTAKVGIYELNMSKITLPAYRELSLDKEMIAIPMSVPGDGRPRSSTGELLEPLSEGGSFTVDGGSAVSEVIADDQMTNSGFSLSGGYLYIGRGSPTSPEVGDMRVSYSVIDNDIEATVFGKLNEQRLDSYVDEDTGTSLYRMFLGTRAEALRQMQGEYTIYIWMFRVIGFGIMWAGLMMLFGPLSVVLNVVPIFPDLSRALITAITFVISLLLSILTIALSIILHT